MVQESGSVSVVAADPDAQRSALEALLEEYHAWLGTTAREWSQRESASGAEIEPAVPEGEYDPAAEAAEDRRALADPDTDTRGFVSFHGGEAVGVVLLYAITEDVAELKRLYVRPEFRGEDVGRALCRAAIDAASERGYERIGLTTPPWSEHAHALYEQIGFEYTDPYPETKLPERLYEQALFMQRYLTA